jgi:hypothetical protein
VRRALPQLEKQAPRARALPSLVTAAKIIRCDPGRPSATRRRHLQETCDARDITIRLRARWVSTPPTHERDHARAPCGSELIGTEHKRMKRDSQRGKCGALRGRRVARAARMHLSACKPELQPRRRGRARGSRRERARDRESLPSVHWPFQSTTLTISMTSTPLIRSQVHAYSEKRFY